MALSSRGKTIFLSCSVGTIMGILRISGGVASIPPLIEGKKNIENLIPGWV